MQKQASKGSGVIAVDTPGGQVTVFGPVCSEEIEKYGIEGSLNSFRPAEKQKQSLIEIASIKDGYVFIAVLNNIIVGYVTFHPPETFERWGRRGHGPILELGAIEVAKELRNNGIAQALLKIAFDGGRMERFIVIATEYYWHWDLEGSGLLVWEYTDKLEKLMAAAGLVPQVTTDPEINAHPANALMVRIGSEVDPFEVKAFEKLRLMTII